jgi:hypothetical protein
MLSQLTFAKEKGRAVTFYEDDGKIKTLYA